MSDNPATGRKTASRAHCSTLAAFPPPSLALAALLTTALLRRHLAAGPARLAQTDRDRLLAALHLPLRTASAQLAALHFVHRALDLLRSLSPVTLAALLPLRGAARHAPARSFDSIVVSHELLRDMTCV